MKNLKKVVVAQLVLFAFGQPAFGKSLKPVVLDPACEKAVTEKLSQFLIEASENLQEHREDAKADKDHGNKVTEHLKNIISSDQILVDALKQMTNHEKLSSESKSTLDRFCRSGLDIKKY